MNSGVDIKLLSKHRGAIMGMAIIMILLCHSSLALEGTSCIAYESVKRFLQIGVDIFLLVSGLGCCFSLNKNNKIFDFYFKRIVKIIVPYIIVLAFWAVIQPVIHVETGIVGFVYKYSLVTFFLRGELSSWYVAAVLVLYALAPYFHVMLKRSRTLFCVLIGVISLLSVALTIIFGHLDDVEFARVIKVITDVFIVRIPVFLVGMLLGNEIYNGTERKIPFKLITAVFGVFVILFILNDVVFPGAKWVFGQWFINRFLYLFASVCIVLFLSAFFHKTSKGRGYKLFVGAGAVTFELYLIHEKVLEFTDKYITNLFNSSFVGSLVSNICAVFLAVVVGILVHRLSEYVSRKLLKR